MPRKKKTAAPATDGVSAAPTTGVSAVAAHTPAPSPAAESDPRIYGEALLASVAATLHVPPGEAIVVFGGPIVEGSDEDVWEESYLYFDERLEAALHRLEGVCRRSWEDIFSTLYEQPDNICGAEYFPRVDLSDEADLIARSISVLAEAEEPLVGLLDLLGEVFGLGGHGQSLRYDGHVEYRNPSDGHDPSLPVAGCLTMHRDRYEKALAALEELATFAHPDCWRHCEICSMYSGDMTTLKWIDDRFKSWVRSFDEIIERITRGGADAIEYERAVRRHMTTRGVGEHLDTLSKSRDERDPGFCALEALVPMGGYGSSGGACGLGWSHSVATLEDEQYGDAVDLCSKISEASEAAWDELRARGAIRTALEAIEAADTAPGGAPVEAAEALLRSRKATSKAWRTGRWIEWLPESPVPGTESWTAARTVLLAAQLAEQRGEAVNLGGLARVAGEIRSKTGSGV